MRLSVLTAALQELTPREQRDGDPDLATEQWLDFARELSCPNIQLSAAMYALQHEVLASQGIPIQGFGRRAYCS